MDCTLGPWMCPHCSGTGIWRTTRPHPCCLEGPLWSQVQWTSLVGEIGQFFTVHGILPVMGEKDIWMRDGGGHCECAVACLDDLPIASRDPARIIQPELLRHSRMCTNSILRDKFNLEGSGTISCHLGCDFPHREDGGCAPLTIWNEGEECLIASCEKKSSGT